MCEHGDTVTQVFYVHYPKLGSVPKTIDVDRCISKIVSAINNSALGLQTVASCCGHGYRPGRISLKDGRELFILPDYESAQALDEQYPLDIHGQTKAERMGRFDITKHDLFSGEVPVE